VTGLLGYKYQYWQLLGSMSIVPARGKREDLAKPANGLGCRAVLESLGRMLAVLRCMSVVLRCMIVALGLGE
jgi:hypothetical protein